MTVSDKFMVNSDAGRMAAARYATESFAWQAKLDKRDTLRLDLLVEETLGMVKSMLEDFYGQLWFSAENKAVDIHFEATADMNAARREELLSMSFSGKNASKRGFMVRLGDLITGAMHNLGKSMDTYGRETMQYGIVHTPELMGSNPEMLTIWTLKNYKNDLNQARGTDSDASAAWDELEKSIVASLADDIIVGVKGDRVDLIIRKQF